MCPSGGTHRKSGVQSRLSADSDALTLCHQVGAPGLNPNNRNSKVDVMARKVLINLATGLEDPERVTVAFLTGGAALQRGDAVAMWLTKEAVRLALPGHAEAVACDGCPPLSQLFEQYADGAGQLLVCPICFNARKLDQSALVSNAKIAGATPMLEWIADDHAAIFSY
jgi:predicted peroxiredoxin